MKQSFSPCTDWTNEPSYLPKTKQGLNFSWVSHWLLSTCSRGQVCPSPWVWGLDFSSCNFSSFDVFFSSLCLHFSCLWLLSCFSPPVPSRIFSNFSEILSSFCPFLTSKSPSFYYINKTTVEKRLEHFFWAKMLDSCWNKCAKFRFWNTFTITCFFHILVD